MESSVLTKPCGIRREVRVYDRDRDYTIVGAWWGSHGLCAPPEGALPRDGYFVVVDGVEMVCAWLYLNNRTDAARVEYLVANPQADGPDVILARDLLCDFLKEQAEGIGKYLELDEPFSISHLRQLLPAEGRDFIATFEQELRKLNVVDFPLTHRFTPGMYIRQIFMPAGSLILTERHKTTHPFVVSQGDLSVWTAESGIVRLRAPYTGITTPGTQRIIYIHEDTIWTTFHVTDETDPEKIKNQITEAGERNELWDSI